MKNKCIKMVLLGFDKDSYEIVREKNPQFKIEKGLPLYFEVDKEYSPISLEEEIDSEGLTIEKSETGFHPYHTDMRMILEELMDIGLINAGTNFLDLGSGDGRNLILAANIGFNSFGVEINNYIHRISQVLIGKAKEDGIIKPGVRCESALGSYFPREYIELIKQNQSVAQVHEKGKFVMEYTHVDILTHSLSDDEIKKVFHPRFSKVNPFKRLNINLSDIDTFFSYTWHVELLAQLELFSLYGKEDAIFLNAPSKNNVRHTQLEEILQRLELKEREISFCHNTLQREYGASDRINMYTKI